MCLYTAFLARFLMAAPTQDRKMVLLSASGRTEKRTAKKSSRCRITCTACGVSGPRRTCCRSSEPSAHSMSRMPWCAASATPPLRTSSRRAPAAALPMSSGTIRPEEGSATASADK